MAPAPRTPDHCGFANDNTPHEGSVALDRLEIAHEKERGGGAHSKHMSMFVCVCVYACASLSLSLCLRARERESAPNTHSNPDTGARLRIQKRHGVGKRLAVGSGGTFGVDRELNERGHKQRGDRRKVQSHRQDQRAPHCLHEAACSFWPDETG